MTEPRYDNIRVVLGESNMQLRSAARSALAAQGFQNIIDAGSFPPLSDAVTSNSVDLVICDVQLLGGDPFVLFNKVRHHETGNNPFILIIMTLETPTLDVVKQVFNCGADDLLVKPLSPKQLMQRIEALSRARKPFVVTHDYIGPDRRKDARPGEGEEVQLIDVPNPLKSKTHGGLDHARMQQIIDKAAVQINEHKMECHSGQIAWLVERIIPALQASQDSTLAGNLNRLLYVTGDLNRRMRGTRFSHVAELAMSMVGLATRIRDAPRHPDPTDVNLLPKLALAIKRAFDSTTGTASMAREISQIVSQSDTK